MRRSTTIAICALFGFLAVTGGAWVGLTLAEYDVLCHGSYQPHRLQREFRTAEGVVLPEGLVVEARRCKPNIDIRLQLIAEKWDTGSIIPAPERESAHPVHFLLSEQEEDQDESNHRLEPTAPTSGAAAQPQR